MKRYYEVTVLLEVEDNDSWGASCDETFHGPGILHDPTQNTYVSSYKPISELEFNQNKHILFDEYGGI